MKNKTYITIKITVSFQSCQEIFLTINNIFLYFSVLLNSMQASQLMLANDVVILAQNLIKGKKINNKIN